MTSVMHNALLAGESQSRRLASGAQGFWPPRAVNTVLKRCAPWLLKVDQSALVHTVLEPSDVRVERQKLDGGFRSLKYLGVKRLQWEAVDALVFLRASIGCNEWRMCERA